MLFLINNGELRMNYSGDLKKLREKMLLTQSEFGQLIGVSFETVNRWENGKHVPSMRAKRKINKLAEKFGAFKKE